MPYTELQVTSNYSFLRGASHVEELLAQAKTLRATDAIAVTDRNTLAGIARAHQRAKEAEIRLIIGCRLDLDCGTSLLVYPTDRAAYSRLVPACSPSAKAAPPAASATYTGTTSPPMRKA